MANEDWKTVDVAELPATLQSAYLDMKTQYRQYKALKDEFEQLMQGHVADQLPDNCELKFGYNFGKLSVAVGPKRAEKAKKQDTGKLEDWLAQQASSGRRS
jgi:hypothetical protein